MARELAPAGLRSDRKIFWDCCAAQREQAPSPQLRSYFSYRNIQPADLALLIEPERVA